MSTTRDTSGQTATSDDPEPLLEVSNLTKHFPINSGLFASIRFDRDAGAIPFRYDDSSVKAVDGVNFSLKPGETFGVVGESGCGKSTLARTIIGLEEPTDGEIRFDGRSRADIGEAEFRRRTQMVFQDPQSSLNSRRKVGHIIADPLEGTNWPESDPTVSADESPKERRKERVLELLEQVGLKREYYNRYPHEFSGGQRQRINLARALSINPDLVIADEPVSGLDVSVQAQILNLMDDLQEEFGLTYLLISHDLSVVRYIADRVAVMYLGEFVEVAPTEQLFAQQHHPYARALLSAVPNPNPDMPGVRSEISGAVPSASNPPRGCRFHTRCPDFILPDGFSREGYAGYDQLLDDVRDRDLTHDDGREPKAIATTYLDDETVPAAARRAAIEAVELTRGDAWEDAQERLTAFESVCQSETPLLESVAGEDTSHVAACHLSFEQPQEQYK